jgi:tetratricopeptide (TPR) repeat protein
MDYDRAIELEPNSILAFYNRGNAYSDLGEYERAIADFDSAIELDPGFAQAFTSRGIAYSYLGEYERAIADFDNAIELDPSFLQAFTNRGIAYSNLGEYERAIVDFDSAIEINPEYASAFYHRGRVYYLKANSSNARRSDLEQALADWREAQRLGASLPQVFLDIITSIEEELSGQILITPTPVSPPRPSRIDQGEVLVSDNLAELTINTFHVWTYAGQRGETLTLTTFAEWNTVLVLADENGETLAQNNNMQGLTNNNSQLSYTFPSSGTYLIAVFGFENATGGEYTLRVESISSREE